MNLTGHSRFLIQAGNLGFPINVYRILCVLAAFAQTKSDTFSLAFFFRRVLLTSYLSKPTPDALSVFVFASSDIRPERL